MSLDVSSGPSLAQRRAADGRRSVWVAASAGTGKTKVLTDRVLNLLLAGTLPGKILCLTFTKAAAAEMSNRLNRRLSSWAVVGDRDLSAEIEGITGRPADEFLRSLARQLFARVLDTPGGMRILTIHAFCQSVLRRFPLEAGVPPQFEVLDERTSTELLAQAQATVLERARAHPGEPLAEALATVTAHSHEGGFAELMRMLALERGRITRHIDRVGGLDPYLDYLRCCLGLDPSEDETSCRAALANEPAFDAPALRRAAMILQGSNAVTDRRTGDTLGGWLSLDGAGRAERLEAHFGTFLTAKGEPRKRLATKGLSDSEPWLVPALEAEQRRVEAGRQRLAANVVNAATAALTRLSAAFIGAYEDEKRRRAVMDYDDLILKTQALLRPEAAPWVLFKLDGGIDHILIDEAQDTNPDQWAVVGALAEEFFSSRGAGDPSRTVFAVGDAKQSIFSFQRADPREFVRMREHFRARAQAITNESWDDVPLSTSFRSTRAVLDVVDAVFGRAEAGAGVALDGQPIRHEAFRLGHAGRVELWPVLDPIEEETPEPWAHAAAEREAPKPSARLARLIAETIRHWLDTGERLASQDRPITAGDVLVLVRRRTGFVNELVRELKRRLVPVAGADRIVLTGQLAVMDLMALGQFLLLPEDDLTLAALLKSPLFGVDETQLFELAHGRLETLWQALRTHPAGWAKVVMAELSALLARADFVPPFELFSGLLSAGRGREKLIGRLGHEAVDAIDEFLAQCLAYEQNHVPSLQGFLSWLERGEAEVKRDLDEGTRGEVRIMTVHGSKGLQAPIVFLPDTVATPSLPPTLLWPERQDVMLWAPPRGGADPVATAARADANQRRDEEYRRLLYVALTRAEDRLYIGGWNGKRAGSDSSWYALIEAGMMAAPVGNLAPIPLSPASTPFPRDGLIHEIGQTVEPKRGTVARSAPAASALPAFVHQPAPRDPTPPRPLIASRPSAEDPPVRSPLGPDLDTRRFQRGLLIHRLLQTLPDLPEAEREVSARRFLAKTQPVLEPEFQDAIARETIAVMTHPDVTALFGPDSRAEVPIVGLIEGPPPRALSARVDRLVVTGREVLVIDYKTNRPPPTERAKVAPAYVEQLALYRAALRRIYPGRMIRTLLLWTDGPSIMEIEDES